MFEFMLNRMQGKNCKNVVPKFTLAKILLASKPETGGAVLAKLAFSKNLLVLCRVAENPSTPPRVLIWLAGHPSPEVRTSVADNIKTPLLLLSLLAHDENADVRLGLAENHNIPQLVLDILVHDDNPYVACRARQTRERINKKHSQYVINMSRALRGCSIETSIPKLV